MINVSIDEAKLFAANILNVDVSKLRVNYKTVFGSTIDNSITADDGELYLFLFSSHYYQSNSSRKALYSYKGNIVFSMFQSQKDNLQRPFFFDKLEINSCFEMEVNFICFRRL